MNQLNNSTPPVNHTPTPLTSELVSKISPAEIAPMPAAVSIEIDLNPLHPPNSPAPPKNTKFLSREQILKVTVDCFSEKGYDGATIRAIASRLGCAVGSIYRYFKDKHKLLLACAEGVINPVVDALADPAETIETSMQRYRLQAQTHPQLYHLLFWLASTDNNQNALPQPIESLIEAWATRLDSPQEAQQLWINLHGQIIFNQHTNLNINMPTPQPNTMELMGLNAHPPSTTHQPEQTPEPSPTPEPTPETTIQVASFQEDMTLL